MNLSQLTHRASEARALDLEEIQSVSDLLLDESIAVAERADFLEALHRRGETPAEIATFVEVLLERAVPLPFSGSGCLDVCGTGGDRAGFFNISTAVMFVAAGAGARVVKHGNRGITSKSGGADVLEALGVRIDRSPESAAADLDRAGCCFLFAPAYHPAFKAVVPVRQLLASRGSASIFNILGPLLNPARPEFQLAGVFEPSLVPTYAGVFKNLRRTRAWAVHGTGPDGLRVDEISPLGATHVSAWENGAFRTFEVDPSSFGIPATTPAALAGGDAAHNAKIILSILDTSQQAGPRHAVQLNAAAALVIAGVAPDLPTAWSLAGATLDEGRALQALESLRDSQASGPPTRP
jgi:anthranilate phosphoribosyltransferase